MNRPPRLARAFGWLYEASWGGLILLLGFTSLPLLADLVRTDAVAAPSVVPAAILFAIWLVPGALRGLRLPFLTLPFLATVTVLLAASALSFALPIFPVKGRTPASEMLDALITLAVAAVVYLVSAAWPKDAAALRRSLRLVNWAGGIVIGWSLVQLLFILAADGKFPGWMHTLQSAFSIRRLFDNRITGFAYEPSWLAHQLNMVFLPWWLAAAVTGFTAHARRFGKVTIEHLLLLGGVVVLGFSFSRVGWLAFGLAFTALAVRLTARVSSRIQERVLRGREPGRAARRLLTAFVFTVLLAVYAGTALGALEIAGDFDPRLDRFFERTEDSPTIYHFANRLAFGERVVAWGTGWEIFNDHPFTGVGLGNAGFFFNAEMPSFGWLLTEFNEIYFRQPYLFNVKSLWFRLPAEGGILALACFVTWLWLIGKSARAMRTDGDPLYRALGYTGGFFLIELAIEGFSLDTFALPYIWFTAGLLTAAAHQYLLRPADPAVHPERQAQPAQ